MTVSLNFSLLIETISLKFFFILMIDKNHTDSSSSTDLDVIDANSNNKVNYDHGSFNKSSLIKLNQANSKSQIRSPSLLNSNLLYFVYLKFFTLHFLTQFF